MLVVVSGVDAHDFVAIANSLVGHVVQPNRAFPRTDTHNPLPAPVEVLGIKQFSYCDLPGNLVGGILLLDVRVAKTS